MEKNSRIFVAGHRGLVGSALVRRLQALGFSNLILRTRLELDLASSFAVAKFFEEQRPDYVFLAAAKVGGIMANSQEPADFIRLNLELQTNVIHNAYVHDVKRLLFLGSSCIYPRDCQQPIKEDYLFTGPLEPTNSAYAMAKIAGIEMCRSYNDQYKTRFLCAMPTNLYGLGDNYDPRGSHVLPALIRKFVEAKQARLPSVTVWGTGTPLREFLFSDDLADACIHLMDLSEIELDSVLNTRRYPLINIGFGSDLSISDLASLVKKVTHYEGEIVFDHSKPDGTPRKLIDSRFMRSLGWVPKVPLQDGIAHAVSDFSSRAS